MDSCRMKHFLFCIGVACVYFVNSTIPVSATTDPKSSDSTISASVPVIVTGGDTTSPTVPILLRPTDNAITADNTPEFVWRRSTDPNGNYVAYTVYLDDVATYLGVHDTGNSSGVGYYSYIDTQEIRLQAKNPLPDGVHTWQVAAYDAAGNHTYSAKWHVTIDTAPPVLTVTSIDTHYNLNLTSEDPASVPEGTRFEVIGPKDITFNISTDTYTSVSILLVAEDGTTIPVRNSTGNQTSITLYTHLETGVYTVTVSATDNANLVTVLPDFLLTVKDGGRVSPPGTPTTPEVVIPPVITRFVGTLYSYPATVARIDARGNESLLYVLLLAAGVLIVIIFLKKRTNLVLLSDVKTPVGSAIVTEMAKNRKYSVLRSDRGRLYMPGLGHSSELMIETDKTTVTLCLMTHERTYTIVLD